MVRYEFKMTLPDHLLDAIYARAIPNHETFFLHLGDLAEARREIARRFVDAIADVMREERETIVDD